MTIPLLSLLEAAILRPVNGSALRKKRKSGELRLLQKQKEKRHELRKVGLLEMGQ